MNSSCYPVATAAESPINGATGSASGERGMQPATCCPSSPCKPREQRRKTERPHLTEYKRAAPCPTAAEAGGQPDLHNDLDYLQLVLTARVYDVAIESPLQLAKNLSARLANHIYLKREDLQPVFSFKLRGAYNRMCHLTPEERNRGVIACSAGNHAQGVALAASKLGIQATIVMPQGTPSIKVNSVWSLGGNVVLHGSDFDEARQECERLSEAGQLAIIHPYDDVYVIAGQGTVGMEIVRQLQDPKLHAVFCSVGGGGLISGVSAFIKRVRPEVKVIGVEAEGADAMAVSLQRGERTRLREVNIFADGAAVSIPGEKTFQICQRFVDEVVVVTNDEICACIKDVFEDTRSILEPAGALSVAGIKKYIHREGAKDKVFVGITSGANMDFNRLRFVAERAELGEHREALLSVVIPETPGSFRELYSLIHPRPITEFSYRYSDPQNARIFLAFLVTDRQTEVEEVIASLLAKGMKAMDLSNNEMAKCHARYLAGGRSPSVSNERLLRFVFPERPGALQRFLNSLAIGWNVSLFHYRNLGADYGRVLAGIQVPPEEGKAFQQFLEELGYYYVDESSNPVYKEFLL
ncbi:threonine deaminase [Balamuthia mandrillaris]